MAVPQLVDIKAFTGQSLAILELATLAPIGLDAQVLVKLVPIRLDALEPIELALRTFIEAFVEQQLVSMESFVMVFAVASLAAA